MVVRTSQFHQTRRRTSTRQGSLQIDLVIALGILALTLLPLASSVRGERRLCRALYHRAIAVSLVDSEAEILLAGEWKRYSEGTHDYTIDARAAKNLPPGTLQLTRTETELTLTWQPSHQHAGGKVSRSVTLPSQP